MQKWLDDNNILVYSTHSEGKSIISRRFIKTLKPKIYKKLIANNIKSYLTHLNKLVDQCNNNNHHSIDKKLINCDYSALSEKIEMNPKATKYKINDRLELLGITIFLVKVKLKIGQDKYLLLILCYKVILGHIKLRI